MCRSSQNRGSTPPTLQQTGLSFLCFFGVFPYSVLQRVVWLWKELILLCPSLRLETRMFYWNGVWSGACTGYCWPVGWLRCEMPTVQVKCNRVFFFAIPSWAFQGLHPSRYSGVCPFPKDLGLVHGPGFGNGFAGPS